MTSPDTDAPATGRLRAATAGRLAGCALVLAFACVPTAACSSKPETRIDDPDCEHCYKLPSGVKYKTYPYYAP